MHYFLSSKNLVNIWFINIPQDDNTPVKSRDTDKFQVILNNLNRRHTTKQQSINTSHFQESNKLYSLE